MVLRAQSQFNFGECPSNERLAMQVELQNKVRSAGRSPQMPQAFTDVPARRAQTCRLTSRLRKSPTSMCARAASALGPC
jgi:hypothetical protein